ncbi:MAG TPA: hypothetical protein VI007_13135 [bacterium]
MDEQPKSREEVLAAIKAKADAIRAQRAAEQAKPQTGAAPAKEPPAVETFVSSLNAAGRPAAAPTNTQLRAYGSVNFAVEIVGEKSEEENLRKLLGGIGAYQNPLRGGAFTIDYRYYAEAKRRLERSGYTITEEQFGPLPPGKWEPIAGGWGLIKEEPKA